MRINFISKVKKISSFYRQFILIFLDFCTIPLSLITTNYLCFGSFLTKDLLIVKNIFFIFLISFIGIIIYYFTGQYRFRTRYVGSWFVYRSGITNFFVILIFFILNRTLRLGIVDFKFLFNFWLVLNYVILFMRFALRDFYIYLESNSNSSKKNKVVIYGAGSAGSLLEKNLRFSGKNEVIFFIDDEPKLWERFINKIRILSPKELTEKNNLFDQIFLAMPSVSRNRKRDLIQSLQKYQRPILEVPSVEEITSGKMRVDQLKPIDLEDLLCRQSVLPNKKLLKSSVKAKNILVTGAGGSIGSELCRQIILLEPKKLILLEHSEHNLYSINSELNNYFENKTKVIPILGSTLDRKLLEKNILEYEVEVIFHAAAYKHVPLVEQNALIGISNNFLSTKILCDLVLNNKVEKFILISTDKAVRPTSVMGASKRLSEIIVQLYADKIKLQSKNKKNISSKKLSIVRFGNVLGSSGSVVPLFKKQISHGGPITLTHPDVERFFMTIREAALLVLQAASLSEGGDVFLLDMGKPRKIIDLAKQMIFLSGLSYKSKNNPEGDVEIVCTGLRPGEKLYEELLIDEKSEATMHPLIFRASERSPINKSVILPKINLIEEYLIKKRFSETLELLSEIIPEWDKSFE